MKRISTYFRTFFKLLTQNDVLFNSSEITFNLILCSIPFNLLVTSIIGFLLRDETAIVQLSRLINDFLPSFFTAAQNPEIDIETLIIDALRPLIERRRVYGILGFFILSFTSLGLFTAIKHVLFITFELKNTSNPVSKYIYNFFAFGLVGGIFVFFTAVVSLFSIVAMKTIQIPALGISFDLGILSETLAIVLPIIFNLSLFYIFFRYGSERKIDRNVCLFGAGVYVFVFEAAKYLFGLYLSYFFLRVQSLYHGYSIILMLGFWAFYGALTFTISVIAAKAFEKQLADSKEQELSSLL